MKIIEIRFENHISEKIQEFQLKYGSSKTFIANKVEMSRQALNSIEKSDNPTIQSLIKIAYVLGCRVEDLYSYKIIYKDK